MKARAIFVLILLILLLIPSASFAQSGVKLTLKSVIADDFPNIRGFLEARTAEGEFIADLNAEDFLAFEDGQGAELQSLRLMDTPWRVAVVVNPSEAFSIRDAQGFNRYSFVKTAIQNWASEINEEEDVSISLISQSGLEIAFTEASNWISGFENFQPDFTVITPDLQALSSALVLTDQPGIQEGAASAIFLITAAPSAESQGQLIEIIANVENQGIPVYIWLVDSTARFDLDEVQALQELAISSGGAYYPFSGTEGLPVVREYFEDLGKIYSFQYVSGLRENGSHEITLSLESDDISAQSQSLAIDIQLEAAKPIFVSPPSLIQRTFSEEEATLLTPFSQAIEIIIEFPDGFKRELVRSSLLLNGDTVAENRSNPFTNFSWDISNFEFSENVLLQVEIEDELGFIGNSVEIPVEVAVASATGDVSTTVVRNVPQFVLVLALLGLGLSLVFLIVTGRISPPSLVRGLTEKQTQTQTSDDPLLEVPAAIADMAVPFGEKQAKEISSEDSPETIANDDFEDPAFLLPLSEEGRPLVSEMMTLQGEEYAFGSDEGVSEFQVKDSSVEERHSLIRRKNEGGFEILDLGGDSGTWINYAPVSSQGAGLANGDLVHIGRAAFRFFLERPKGRSIRERAK